MIPSRNIFARIRTAVFTAVVGFFVALPVFAQDVGLNEAASIGLTTTDIRTLVARIISYFLGFLGFLAVILMLYAGFTWMTAGGNEEKIQKAKQIMISATIGLLIILMSYAIVAFVLRAITGGSGAGGLGGPGGCPPGQTCSFGGGGGGAGGFRITGVVPAGPGPASGGWPKNYALSIWFNATVAESSVSASNVEVRRCNARVSGGTAETFDITECGAPLSGTRTVDGSKIIFKPDTTPGDEPTDFEADFWYSVRVQGGAVRDALGRTLICPFNPAGEAGDISSANAQRDLCDRAAAFNDQRDVAPPTVTVDSPASPPAFCGLVPVSLLPAAPVPVHATAQDDFLVAGVDYLLDGGSAGLLDEFGDPLSSDANAALLNPFSSLSIYVDIASLASGPHRVTAVAQDGVPQSSAPSEMTFNVSPANCCNGVRDEAEGETAIDCGGACGFCPNQVCTDNAECASGFCDETGHCAERPIIDSVAPMAAGPGSLITITGRFLGSAPGRVVFRNAAGEDVEVNACAPDAWTANQVVVAVPAGAATGPIRITTSAGQSDSTDDARGPNLGAFLVNGSVLPGICSLTPRQGAAGSEFVMNGTGFGATLGTSTVTMGSNNASVAAVKADGTGGWTETQVTLVVPPVSERSYPVRVTVGGVESNAVDFRVGGDGASSGNPRVISVSPESGPVGSYVTVQGSGFGRLKGSVFFWSGIDKALAQEPICAENWRDNYVVVKVPSEYQGGLPVAFGGLPGIAHTVQVTTVPYKPSNNDVVFRITNEAPRPGICAISPDNGRPGKTVEITGEGFGSSASTGPSSAPRYSVEFYKDATTTVQPSSFSSWSQGSIGTIVAGEFTDESTWPVTGPVRVVSANERSSNSIPFTISDCNASGASCSAGTSCCANGSCQASCVPAPRESAYGWLFSTSVLPSFPTVVENALCRSTPTPATLQSPSPYKGSTDACKNAEVRVEFTHELQMDLGTLGGAVEFKECGQGATPVCGNEEITNLSFEPRDCGAAATSCRVLTFTPPDSYNAGTPNLKEGTWYQVRLGSNPQSSTGFREPGVDGRYLDGNNDRRQGGDYVFTFKTRASAAPCELASVFVDPPRKIIDQDFRPVDFHATPTGANCNSLRCEDPLPYSVAWAVNLSYFRPLLGASLCTQPVHARRETALTEVRSTMTPNGSSLSRTGLSDVTVRFAEPRVTVVTPVAACTEACINADIVATFNVPMNEASLTMPGNVELLKCRNASCTAPYLPLTPTVRTAEATPVTDVIGEGPEYRDVSITGSEGVGNLESATFYRVRIRGGASGVVSRSGALLGGLNDGEWYTWTFRTKDDDTECLASRSSIEPSAATLYFIGQRHGLSVTPFGSPDECNANGQPLLPGAFSWNWSLDVPNPAIGGFVDGTTVTPEEASPLGTTVNTDSSPTLGCTNLCLLRGSQNAVPQCGNGIVEARYEECDGAGAGCTARCTYSGTAAPTCGNGSINPGENCEAVDVCVGGEDADRSCDTDAGCRNGTCSGSRFPAGCKQPGTQVDGFASALGCVLTGSSTAVNSRCGDGFVADGEACDDSNTANGDGCSADCLKEGTLPSCLGAAVGAQCINFCGNRVVEPGEDAECEPNPGENGCSVTTCLKLGTPKCSAGSECCGNGVVDDGEDATCETDPDGESFCTERCLLKGSSAFHPQASFCGDNYLGQGEQARCEGNPDTRVDAYQVVTMSPQPGFNAQSSAGSTSTVRATTAGIAQGQEGSSNVTLSCTCGSKPADERDSFCSSYQAGLACAMNGCCAQRPLVTTILPGYERNDVCRNTAVSVTFNQVMDASSLQRAVLVGFDNGTAACPTGTTAIALGSDGSTGEGRSFLRRVVDAIVGFFRNYIFRPVFASANPAGPFTSNVFCAVEATVTVTHEGSPSPQVSVAHLSIKNALPADRWIIIRVTGEARSALGVNVASAGARSYFGTSSDICTVDNVTVSPASALLSSVNDPAITLTAHAISRGQQEIVSTPEYPWEWQWTPQTSTAPSVSPIVLEPRSETPEPRHRDVRVRGSRPDLDSPANYVPQNGQAVAEAAAIIGTGASVVRRSGTAGITVLLCDNPWPARRVCGGGSTFTLPWDANPLFNSCTPNAAFWYPYYDRATNFSFYYCRDGSGAGDVAATLPYLSETPAVVTPGRDILKEYLFTYYVGAMAPAPGSTWSKDAIGIRVNFNPTHVGTADWYASKGFRGAASPTTVDGFDAIRDGRTTYVNAAALPEVFGGNIFTNVNVFSYTDGAAPETISVYDQILSNVDFMSASGINYADGGTCVSSTGPLRCNVDADCKVNAAGSTVAGFSAHTCDAPRGVCLDGTGAEDSAAGIAVACSTDLDCRKGLDGRFVLGTDGQPARNGFSCWAPKQKLTRDVKRWADLQSMRATLSAKAAVGQAPKLAAGTFLSTMSVSAWPSWSDTLSASAGKALPEDPVNRFGWCENTDRSGATCWNDKDRSYLCAPASHVYEYQYFQTAVGQDFRIRADFEFPTIGLSEPVWAGQTCIEKSGTACDADPLCINENGACNYRVGKLQVGGVNQTPNCSGDVLGEGNVCGDGRVGPGEACEPGQEKSITCSASGGTGLLAQICTSNCLGWTARDAGAPCVTGYCGDGLVRGAEVCDDGSSLNGTYGHCAKNCDNFGFRCGDGERQPNEQCDCRDLNGQYAFDGISAPATRYGTGGAIACGIGSTDTPTCSWDCSGAGPRCGDGVVNGIGEICDGDIQTFRGFCNDIAQTGCETDADCPSGRQCGSFCSTVEERRRRVCRSNDPSTNADDATACTWPATWTCVGAGSCGNGTKETGEECDDGNDSNTDACTTQCKTARCGDGYTNPAAGEQCDDAADNNARCTPEYALACTYCSSACKLLSVSGGFCGDSVIQSSLSSPRGPEECDGALGLSANYICVSTRPEFQSWGVRTRSDSADAAICAANNCMRACPAPDSAVCVQPNGDPNLDSGGANPGATSAQWTSPEYQSFSSLGDTCDPDDDNDGVPDNNPAECNPRNALVHGAYRVSYISVDGTAEEIDVPAAAEICDNIDNDCDGLVDNDWQLAPLEDAPPLNFEGNVVDAFFPDQAPINGAEVVVTRGLCSVDRVTKCNDNGQCGGGVCNSFGKCSHDDAVSCTTDVDCPGANGVCGINDPVRDRRTTTNSSGFFRITDITKPALCPMKIQVRRYVPNNDLVIPFMTASPDELEEREGRGYFAQDLPIPTGATGTIYFDGDGAGHEERIFLVPVPRPGTAILAFVWSGNLGSNYMDAYLSIPGDLGGTAFDPNPISYQNQNRHSLTANPFARLVCDSSSGSGDPTSCNAFNTSPELVTFRIQSQNVATGSGYKFFVDDYSCSGANCNGNRFRTIRAKVVGGYNNGLDEDGDGTIEQNSVAGGSLGPWSAPTSGGAKYWHIMDWRRTHPNTAWYWTPTFCDPANVVGTCNPWSSSMIGQP